MINLLPNPKYVIYSLMYILLIVNHSISASTDIRADYRGYYEANNGGKWGGWLQGGVSHFKFCDTGEYIIGFKMLAEKKQRNGDDTSTNNIRFECTDGKEIIIKTPTKYGRWNELDTCPGKTPFVVGFRTRVESDQRRGDDTAFNGLTLKCNENHLMGQNGHWGKWGAWQEFPLTDAACGFNLKSEKSQGNGDDTALNSIAIAYCSYQDKGTLPSLKSWMSSLNGNVKLNNIIIPGTHDAGTWPFNGKSYISKSGDQPELLQMLNNFKELGGNQIKQIFANWSRTQDSSIISQLNKGVRYFDIRLEEKKENLGSLKDKSLYFVHGMYGNNIDASLAQIKKFIGNNKREIIILDFQKLHEFTAKSKNNFIGKIVSIFGDSILPVQDGIDKITLSDLWEKDKNIIVLMADTENEPLIWDRSKNIESKWTNSQTTETLHKNLSQIKFSTNKINVLQVVLTADLDIIKNGVLKEIGFNKSIKELKSAIESSENIMKNSNKTLRGLKNTYNELEKTSKNSKKAFNKLLSKVGLSTDDIGKAARDAVHLIGLGKEYDKLLKKHNDAKKKFKNFANGQYKSIKEKLRDASKSLSNLKKKLRNLYEDINKANTSLKSMSVKVNNKLPELLNSKGSKNIIMIDFISNELSKEIINKNESLMKKL